MAKYCGSDFVVAAGNGDGPPETFDIIASMRSTDATINKEQVDGTTKSDVPWRQLINCGISSMDISLSGPFTDDSTHDDMVADAVAGTIKNYRLTSGRGDQFEGPFQISSLERSGEYNAEEQFSLTLVSAGDIVYTPAP